MKVSIVMTYFNRRTQLLNTLRTISYYGHDPEIIVVDDASSERIDDIEGIKVVRIEPKDKWWINTCIPYNTGFAHATGDIIIIQNAECMYTGDIIGYAMEHLKPNDWLSFGAYSLDWDIQFGDAEIPSLKERMLKEPQQGQVNHVGWYNHSKYRPVGFHFCVAVHRADLEELGGFDERYAMGLAHEDDDLLLRVRRKPMNEYIVDEPFVIHQKHERTRYGLLKNEYKANSDIYHMSALKEPYVKAPVNKIYGREWHLTPKILHVYWGEGLLPYLRYMTVVSFMKHNPSWEVWLWYPEFPSTVVTWKTTELNYTSGLTCDNYLPKLKELPVKQMPLNFNTYGFKNDASESHKSDFLRYFALHEVGGVYSDMDVFYFKPITELECNVYENHDKEVFVCMTTYGHSNGLLMSKKGAEYYKRLKDLCNKEHDPNEFQSVGPNLCNKYFPTLASITAVSPVANIGVESVYCNDGQHIRDIYNGQPPKFTKNSIGIHWFGGHPLTGAFLQATNGGLTNLPDNVIGNLLK